MTAQELRERISANAQAWHETKDEARRKALHRENEALYGELDKLTGSTSAFDEGTGHWTTSLPGAGDYAGEALPRAKDLSDQVERREKAAADRALAGLQRAKGEAEAALDAREEAIGETYQAARNQAAAQSEVERQNLNERAAESGLNTGAAGQLALGESMAAQGVQGELTRREAAAHEQVDEDRAALEADYAYAVQEARAEGDYALAEALYREAARLDEADRDRAYRQEELDREAYRLARENRQEEARAQERADALRYEGVRDAYERDRDRYQAELKLAQTRAGYGDFQGFARLGYSQEEIDAMTRLWRYYQFVK